MVNNTRVILNFPIQDLHMSYFQVIGLQGIHMPILLYRCILFQRARGLKRMIHTEIQFYCSLLF